jgi:Ca-activated chloride channel family protein
VVKIDLTAAGHKNKVKRTPLNLAVVLDRSGSMTGAKIEKARQAAMGLVDQLAPGDLFSLIAYSDFAEVLVPAQELEDKEAVKSRISRIRPGGSTALYAGVELGATQIQRHLSSRRINRVILLSDGLANVGPSSTQELRQLGHALCERGISVSTIGVGDDYNEDLMAGLAEASDANYYYVKDTERLPGIFAKELGELVTVAAREVRIEIICPKGVRPIGPIGRPEVFSGQKASVQLSQLALEQNRYLFLRCLVNEPQPEIAAVTVRYTDELNGGTEQSLSERARVRFTEDESVAAKSERAEIVAQKELLLTAVAKDAAQSQLRQEAENLRLRANQLGQNEYDAGTRKAMQSESWNVRNSK